MSESIAVDVTITTTTTTTNPCNEKLIALRAKRQAMKERFMKHQWMLEEITKLHDQLYTEFRAIRKEFEALELELAEQEGKIVLVKTPSRQPSVKPAKDPVDVLKEAMSGMTEEARKEFVAQLLGQ
jgi:transposase-like protein